MAGHFLFGVPDTPQCSVDGIVADGAVRGAHAGEEESPVAGVAMQFPEDCDSLGCQRDDVLFLHFHAFGWDSPFGFLEIEFIPARASKLTGTDEDQRGQLEGAGDGELAFVVVDCPEEFSDFLGIDDGWVVAYLYRGEGALEVGGHVALGSAGGDIVFEYLAADLEGAVGGFQSTAFLNVADGHEDFRRLDVEHIALADVGEYVLFQADEYFFAMIRSPGGQEFDVPFASDRGKAVFT